MSFEAAIILILFFTVSAIVLFELGSRILSRRK